MCVSAAVSGRSSVLDVNSLLTGLHLLLTSLRVTSWWEHVDTHANPADGGKVSLCAGLQTGHVMQTGETAWNPTGVGKVSLCAGLHGGRWSHRVVEVFQDLCLARIVKSVVKSLAANDVSRSAQGLCQC